MDHEARHPKLSYLFWEATLGCNMACRHCGSDCHRSSDLSDELTGEEVVRTFRQIAGDYNPRKLFIAVTGGEPLVRPDLFDVMAEIAGMGFPWGMVTNGWSVDEKVVERSRRTGMRTLVVSLDGVDAASHDWLRGKGSFVRAVKAIELYRDAGFLTDLQVTSTYHRRNIHELEDMFGFLRGMGVRDWRVVSVFPNGRAVRQDDFMLRPTELQGLLDFIRDKRSRPQPMVVSYGDEGYLGCDHERRVRDFYYACFAGVRIASILANGDVSGCPNIPRSLAQGNVRKESLKSVWENRFQRYRDRSWMQKGICVDCGDFAICKGNSMHLWDTETDGPKLCHARMLQESRTGVADPRSKMVGSDTDAEETRG